jgi:NAD(P)H-hydrate epimerase
MNTPTLSRDRVRQLDQRALADYGVPGIVLMENAGRGVADTLCRLGIGGLVVICCGPGNNGGDGFVIARHLDLRSIAVKVLVWGNPGHAPGKQETGDAAINYRILERSGVPMVKMAADAADNTADGAAEVAGQLAGAAWIVDALLGTGAKGEPRPPLAAAIDAINGAGVPIMAVDLPSGLDCDTGHAAEHTIRAAHTCTFVAEKPGFLMTGASAFTGAVHVVDIGAPRNLVEEMLAGR